MRKKTTIRTYHTIERITKMYALIRAGSQYTAFDFAEMFKVSHKTIMRDLDFMRDRIRLPIVYKDRRWAFDSTVRLPWWLEKNNAVTL